MKNSTPAVLKSNFYGWITNIKSDTLETTDAFIKNPEIFIQDNHSGNYSEM